MQRVLLFFFSLCTFCACAVADTISINGSITQSTQDSTGPAVNNPSLNNINDGQLFSVTLVTPTGITAPGVYDLTGSPLTFSVPTAPASETNFGSITLTITANGSFADYSLFACVLGSDCFQGNSLSASFEIPLGSIAAMGVTATGLDQPHPFDLLEDDGSTEIQGQIGTYSNTAQGGGGGGVAVTPEPPSFSLVLLSCLMAGAGFAIRSKMMHSFGR